jgi:hypothetical protein
VNAWTLSVVIGSLPKGCHKRGYVHPSAGSLRRCSFAL